MITPAQRKDIQNQVEEWVTNMLGPVEHEDLEEVAEIIQKTVEDVLEATLTFLSLVAE